MFKKNLRGQTAIVAVVIILSIALTIVASMSTLMQTNQRLISNSVHSLQSYYAAEAGMEDSVYRVLESGLDHAATGTLTINGATATMTITQTSSNVDIVSVGNLGDLYRKIVVNMSTTPTVVSFHYGVHVGEGGVFMENNSIIDGNVYVNGDLIAENSARITGDAWAAGPTAKIENFRIDGDAHAHSLVDDDIGGDAYFQTISGTTVDGTLYPGSPDPEPISLPIPQSQIDDWKAEAQAGGTITTNYLLDDVDTVDMGPYKINGNLTIKNSAIMTMTGTIWVTGNVLLENNGALQLSPSMGSLSGIMIVDGTIDIKNNFAICGTEGFNTGTGVCNAPTESYIMLLSTSSADPAIHVQNNSSLRTIVYAQNGTLLLENNAAVKEATGHAIHVKNNAAVNYETGLVNVEFSSGPGGGWDVTTWKEAE